MCRLIGMRRRDCYTAGPPATGLESTHTKTGDKTMMKLSEAIRLGATLRPQGFGRFIADGKSCAWGAAYEAIGSEGGPTAVDPSEWFWFYTIPFNCPECGADERKTGDVIIHLNDFHHWTRERIADWVATIEPQDAPEEQIETVSELAA